MLKFARLDEAFLEVFLTASKPSRRSITAAKRKKGEKRRKKIPKIEKPKDVGQLSSKNYLKILISAYARVKMW